MARGISRRLENQSPKGKGMASKSSARLLQWWAMWLPRPGKVPSAPT